MTSLTALTVTMPGREDVLAECCRSVWNQSVRPAAHLIRSSPPDPNLGPSPVAVARESNRLVNAAREANNWVSFVEDDDLLLREHFLTHTSAMRYSNADVIVTWSDRIRPPAGIHRGPDLVKKLRETNLFPACATVRRSLLVGAGGFPSFINDRGCFMVGDEWTDCVYQDWALWLLLAGYGAVFLVIPEITWSYRFDESRSMAVAWGKRIEEMRAAL